MAYQLEETGDLTRTASVNIPADEYEAGVSRELRRLSKRVKVRGFRKGKIPMNVMRSRYGDAVQQDVIEKLVRTNVNTIVDEAKRVLHISAPQVTSFPTKGVGDLEFKVELELRPEIDPIGYLGVEVSKPKSDVTDEEIDQELEGMRQQYASFEDIKKRKTIKAGDVVTFDFAAVTTEDPALEDFQGEGAQVVVGESQAMPGVEKALEGAKFDSTVTATVETGDDFQIEELRNKSFEVEITIKAVQQRVLPELDDQFAKDSGEAETIDELREKTRERIQGQKEHSAGHIAENNLLVTLLEANTFNIPPKFLDEQLTNAMRQRLEQMSQQGADLSELSLDPEAFRENLREERERAIKTDFLLIAIAEKENISVEPEDMQAYFEHQALHMKVPADALARYMAEDQERLRQASASALMEKTVNHLLAEAKVVDGDWPDPEAKPKEAKKAAAKPKAEKAAAKAEKAAAKPKAEKAAAKPKAEKAKPVGDARAAFDAMKVGELKELLKANDLKVGGKKGELVDRLVEAGINA